MPQQTPENSPLTSDIYTLFAQMPPTERAMFFVHAANTLGLGPETGFDHAQVTAALGRQMIGGSEVAVDHGSVDRAAAREATLPASETRAVPGPRNAERSATAEHAITPGQLIEGHPVKVMLAHANGNGVTERANPQAKALDERIRDKSLVVADPFTGDRRRAIETPGEGDFTESITMQLLEKPSREAGRVFRRNADGKDGEEKPKPEYIPYGEYVGLKREKPVHDHEEGEQPRTVADDPTVVITYLAGEVERTHPNGPESENDQSTFIMTITVPQRVAQQVAASIKQDRLYMRRVAQAMADREPSGRHAAGLYSDLARRYAEWNKIGSQMTVSTEGVSEEFNKPKRLVMARVPEGQTSS